MKRRDPEFTCPKCWWYGVVLEYDKVNRDVTKCPTCDTVLVPYNHKKYMEHFNQIEGD